MQVLSNGAQSGGDSGLLVANTVSLSPLWVTRKPHVCTLYKALGASVRAATYWHLEKR